MIDCPCTCHGHGTAFQPPCSVLGGCGHLHTAEQSSCKENHREAPAPQCFLSHRDHNDGCERTETVLDALLVCRWHRGRLDWVVEEISVGFVELQLVIVAGTAPKEAANKGGKHSKSPYPAAPVNLDVVALRDARTAGGELRHILSDGLKADVSRPVPAAPVVVGGWLKLVAEERPLTAKLPSQVLGQLDVLKRHHEWIAAQPWVDEYLREMSELKRAISSALRDNTHRFMGRCYLIGEDGQVCNGELLQENGTEFVQCRKSRSHQWRTPRELAALEYGLTQARTA